MTLYELKKWIAETLEENPEWAGLPLAYAIDDEGNAYHKIHNEPTLAVVSNASSYELDVIGQRGDKGIKDNELNCVIIN
jgi:hypothetical protein